MKNKTAFFTGHRNIKKSLYNDIEITVKNIVVNLIRNGVIYYGVGGAIGFDTLASFTILSLKRQYPQIKLIVVLPCKNHTKFWSYKDIILIDEILKKADKIVYISDNYTKNCMLKRNIHLIKHSKYCICYYDNSNIGGTSFSVRWAKRYGLKIYNIHM